MSASKKTSFTDEQSKFLAEEAESWAMSNGLIVQQLRCVDNCNASMLCYTHSPLAVLPVSFPRTVYDSMNDLTLTFNELYDKVASDEDFLLVHLDPVAKQDDFVRRQLDLLRLVQKERKVAPPAVLAVCRSDYMLQLNADDGSERGLQVEYNTMAASFGALSQKVAEWHRHAIERFGPAVLGDRFKPENLPPNNTLSNLASAFNTAFRMHPAHTEKGGCIVMVVQPNEKNYVDQRLLEYTIFKNHAIPVIRKTMAEIAQEAKHSSDGHLCFQDGSVGVIVYFRAGYTPADYPTESEWEAKEKIELSSAIVCPDVGYWLAGSKKIQQLLCRDDILQKYLPDEKAREMVMRSFAGMWSLEENTPETKRVIEDAIANPDKYVLKPQREGGGNNLWKQEIVDKLTTCSDEERAAYVLMEVISSNPVYAMLLRDSKVEQGPCASELGIFSTFVKQTKPNGDDVVVHSEQSGLLLRTKFQGTLEGGVASGYACLSSPILV